MKTLCLHAVFIGVVFVFVGASHHDDTEEALYKKVLPYIKEVTLSGSETEHQIRKTRHHKKRVISNLDVLNEIDTKVLPWLNHLTSTVNSIAEQKAGKIDEILHKKSKTHVVSPPAKTHIKGPSALKTPQTVIVVGNTTTKLNNNNQHFRLQPNDKENEVSIHVASEVAKLTNQIAQFEQDMIALKKARKKKLKMSKAGQSFTKIIGKISRKKALAVKQIKNVKQTKINKQIHAKVIPAKTKAEQQKKRKSVKIIFGGNVGLDGIVRYKVEEDVCSFNESFDGVKKLFKAADHAIVNLESSLGTTKNEHEGDSDKLMERDNQAANALRYAGIDTVVLSNEHILDNGPEAGMDTKQLLEQNNLLVSGISEPHVSFISQEPVIFATNGVTIGLLSYCGNTEGCKEASNSAVPFNEAVVKREVVGLRESSVDVVIIYVHWAHDSNLTKLHEVKAIVRRLASVKIDALIGCHPYIEQHYYYKHMLVVLNLGNLLTPMHVHISKPHNNHYTERQHERWEMPSMFSKILQIEVNRDGLIAEKSSFLSIRIGLNKNHCLQAEKFPGATWTKICSKKDRQCLRNY